MQSVLAGSEWMFVEGSNISVTAVLARVGVPAVVPVAVAVMVVWLAAGRLDVRRGVGVAVVVGVLASPIAWFSYLVSTVPLWPYYLPRRVGGFLLRLDRDGRAADP